MAVEAVLGVPNGILFWRNNPEARHQSGPCIVSFNNYQEHSTTLSRADLTCSWGRGDGAEGTGPSLSQHQPSPRRFHAARATRADETWDKPSPAPPGQDRAEPANVVGSASATPPTPFHHNIPHRHRLTKPSSTMSNGESRESLDLLASAAEQSSPQSRIKRNTACVSCRDSKVRPAAHAWA